MTGKDQIESTTTRSFVRRQRKGVVTYLRYYPCLRCLVGGVIVRPLREFDVPIGTSDGQVGVAEGWSYLGLSLERGKRERREGKSGDRGREIVDEPTPVDFY